MGMGFSAKEIETIAGLLRDGFTASAIGSCVGRSRNSIVGIVHRHPVLKKIGFARPAPKMVEMVKKRRAIEKVLPKLKDRVAMQPDPEPIMLPTEILNPVLPEAPTASPLLWELREHHCRWPMWSEDVHGINQKRFCGATAQRGHYCGVHSRIMYSASPARGVAR